jgi:hypothetical protein
MQKHDFAQLFLLMRNRGQVKIRYSLCPLYLGKSRDVSLKLLVLPLGRMAFILRTTKLPKRLARYSCKVNLSLTFSSDRRCGAFYSTAGVAFALLKNLKWLL